MPLQGRGGAGEVGNGSIVLISAPLYEEMVTYTNDEVAFPARHEMDDMDPTCASVGLQRTKIDAKWMLFQQLK